MRKLFKVDTQLSHTTQGYPHKLYKKINCSRQSSWIFIQHLCASERRQLFVVLSFFSPYNIYFKKSFSFFAFHYYPFIYGKIFLNFFQLHSPIFLYTYVAVVVVSLPFLSSTFRHFFALSTCFFVLLRRRRRLRLPVYILVFWGICIYSRYIYV